MPIRRPHFAREDRDLFAVGPPVVERDGQAVIDQHETRELVRDYGHAHGAKHLSELTQTTDPSARTTI
jgi:hypothetical protein